MWKILVMAVLVSLFATSCGTFEIELDTTATPVDALPSAQATSDQALPTETTIPLTSEPTTTACSNQWFFTFDEKHLSLAAFCPAPAKLLEAVGEDFEGGRVYRYAPDPDYPADQRGTVYIIYNDGEWVTFPDTWDNSQASSDATIVPPEGRYQPVDSIGKVWRENSEVRQRLGWAYEPQNKFQGRVQTYSAESGGDSHFIFIDHGKWGLVLVLNSVDMGPNSWEVAGTYQ